MPKKRTRTRRRRPSRSPAAALAALLLTGCSVPAEQPILQQFFAESRLRDLTALQKFSTVVFEPRTDGIVRAFEIVGVSPLAGTTERVSVKADVAAPDGTMRSETIDVILDHRGGDWRVIGFARRP